MDRPARHVGGTGLPIARDLDRRRFLGRSLLAAASVSALGTAATGCGGSSTPNNQVKVSKGPPSYYPDDYTKVVEAAKKEGGTLTIYSNMAVYNWKPIIDAFKQRYPWVQEVKTNNLASGEVFQRYYNEQATGVPAADLLVSGAPQNWIDFVKKGQALDYESPEASRLPKWSLPRPGLFTFSADPILMAYNKGLLPEDQRPAGMAHLAKLAEADPEKFKDKITTYTSDVPFSFGFAINWNYVADTDGGWEKLERLLPFARPESSSGPMVDKLNAGEYLAGYFLSSTVVLPAVEDAGQILGWSYIEDGTPIFLRGMGIAKEASHQNTAKLMLDFLLSHDGQAAVHYGGFTPYREDLKASEAERTYQSVVREVGKNNIVRIGYEPVSASQAEEFIGKWKSAVR